MRIVADENIPLVENYFGSCGELILKPGRAITRKDVLQADILLIRSVTQVNQALLQDTQVKFVGSATTGFDHLDTDWLNQAGIEWCVAKGSNAQAVVDYVVCVVAALQKTNFLTKSKLRAGVIGVGVIGSQVAGKLERLGFDVVLCDPFRRDIISTPLSELQELDLISIHTPLTKTGYHPTYHLIQKGFLGRQKPGCVLLNTSRGEVINFDDLKLYGQHLIWCLDVWENEPNIDVEVLEAAVIATPHIAGYSVQSKLRGVEMLYQAALARNKISCLTGPIPELPVKTISFDNKKIDWRDAVLAVFNPLDMTKIMQAALIENENGFDELRKQFNDRYEFGFVKLDKIKLSAFKELHEKQSLEFRR